MRKKLAEMYDLVETNLAASAHKQASQYDKSTRSRKFQVGDRVWLSIPTAGKLQPKWEGEWKIVGKRNAVNYIISDGTRTRTVHINRLKKRFQPDIRGQESDNNQQQWSPPRIDHLNR